MSVSPASLRCKSVIPSTRCASSRDLGWTSLLVDVHTGIVWNEPYAAVTTLDPRIGVSLSGHYLSHFYSKGVWRPDVYRPGTTTLLRSDADRRFRFTPLDGDECEFALIYFPLRTLEETAEHLRRPGQRLSVPWFSQLVARDPAIEAVTRALIRAMEQGASELYAETVSAWLAAHVLTQRAPEDARAESKLLDRRLRRVLEHITAHFADRLTLTDLAALAGVSKYHFTRLFREKVGLTPHQFLTKTRLDAARRLLLDTDLGIGDIAFRCGYTSAAHFTTAFSAAHAISPAKLRASRR